MVADSARNAPGAWHVPLIAAATRQIQKLQPGRPFKGAARVLELLERVLPRYQGIARLADGRRFVIDTHQPVEFWVLYTGDFERAVAHVVKQYLFPGSYCMDIGANTGYFAMTMAHATGQSGRVAAFEPNPSIVERIRRNIALNGYTNVDVVDKAVHSRVEPLTFYISHKSTDSTFYMNDRLDFAAKLTVETTTIDLYIERRRWERLDIVKIDAEGNDCNMLLGARTALQRFRSLLIFECSRTTPDAVAVPAFDMLAEYGYSLYEVRSTGGLVPFERKSAKAGLTIVVCFPR